MSATETPLKLEHEQIIENLLEPLRAVLDLVPKASAGNTSKMGIAILQNLHQAGVPTHVAGPVLAYALDQIMTAVLGRSRELRAQGLRNPADPKERDA